MGFATDNPRVGIKEKNWFECEPFFGWNGKIILGKKKKKIETDETSQNDVN